MTFKEYIPYSQLEIDIIESNNDFIEYFYSTLKELKEYHGEDCEYTIIEINDIFLLLNDGFCLSLSDIGLN